MNAFRAPVAIGWLAMVAEFAFDLRSVRSQIGVIGRRIWGWNQFEFSYHAPQARPRYSEDLAGAPPMPSRGFEYTQDMHLFHVTKTPLGFRPIAFPERSRHATHLFR
ncbi:MAG: hypothetical protein A3G24_11160 [Betaproteobacteria bacterium RIFCSPLOWO2_12_FULL_62_13]|nr:MAG: hypothetical protein A3G24_11160 [Betaproteobacteria bacterium RIFCSPLOWO2_12_FULL_62_13]